MNRQICTVFILFFLVACNEKAEKAKAAEPVTLPPQYYYFPKANVYVDSANMDFLFIANDGKTWQSAKQIPAAMQALMDKNVFIENPSQPVWKDNNHHRLVYSALLYATANDTLKKEPPKPVVEPARPNPDSVKDAKEKKGLRKFLDKIFGKNKKDKRKDSAKQEE